MSILGAALALVLAAPAPAAPARPLARPEHNSASLDKDRVTLGEPFTLTIEITHAGQDAYSLPQLPAAGELTLRGPPSVSRKVAPDGSATTTFKVPLVDLKTLEPRVPDLTLLVEGPEGSRVFTVKGLPLSLVSVVEPDGNRSKEQGPRAPKPPVPIYVRSWLWAALLFGLAALAALLYGAARLGKRAKEERDRRNVPAPPEPADEALQRIALLRARKPWERGLGRAAIFELSEIVRVYLGKRLGFDALDFTSDELLSELRRRRVLGLDLAELTEDLAWEGLVKFAKLEPTAGECLQALERAAALIQRTRPVALRLRSPQSPPPPQEARA